MSPAPRKKPAALENVGAASTAVAANAPKMPRREMLEELSVVIVSRLSRRFSCPTLLCGIGMLSPDVMVLLHRMIL